MVKTTRAKQIEVFLLEFRRHIYRKENLYDGINSKRTSDECIRFAIEELGEIASALTRDRHSLARNECFDLAHTTLMIYLSIAK